MINYFIDIVQNRLIKLQTKLLENEKSISRKIYRELQRNSTKKLNFQFLKNKKLIVKISLIVFE